MFVYQFSDFFFLLLRCRNENLFSRYLDDGPKQGGAVIRLRDFVVCEAEALEGRDLEDAFVGRLDAFGRF